MKKSLVLAAAVAAMSVSTAASAIDTAAYSATRPAMVSDGFGALGVVNWMLHFPLPAGNAASFNQCRYILAWQDPQNINNVATCELREFKGVANPACNQNAGPGGTPQLTSVVAGAGMTTCNGYDLGGVPVAGITLILSEQPGGGVGKLSGVALYPVGIGFPLPILF